MSAPATFDAATGTDPRDCRVYRFICLDPHTSYTTRRVGYIGESIRMPFVRMLEHVYNQWWADTIVAWEVYDEVYPSKGSALAAEEAAVRAEMPLYNDEYNHGNPDRIPLWKQEQQARERGTTARPAPMYPNRPRRQASQSSERAPQQRTRRVPAVRAERRPRGWWLMLWFVLAVILGVWTRSVTGVTSDGVWVGAGGGTLLVALMVRGTRRRRRRR